MEFHSKQISDRKVKDINSYWDKDPCQEIIEFLSPVTGKIVPEYLRAEDGSVMLEQGHGNPDQIQFLDGSRISCYHFKLYVRTHGRDSAARKNAVDKLIAAANLCETETPFEGGYIALRKFPYLFNRNMSGYEEYCGEFSLYWFVPAAKSENSPE